VFTALDLAQDNYASRLDQAISIVRSGRDDPAAYFSIAWSWRILGECRLLADANVDAFVDYLGRAAQARLAFLRKVGDGLKAEPQFVCASKNMPFTSALAVGDMATAREIAQLSATSHYPTVEYEDDFLFFHFLHRLTVAPEDTPGQQVTLARWKDVLEGGESGALAACRALSTRSAEDFTPAFASFIAKRQTGLAEYRENPAFNEQLFAAEGHVYVEALALLRFAELRGLPTEREYPLVPAMARVPVQTEKSADGRWLSPVS